MENAALAPQTDNIKAIYLAAEDIKVAASILYQAYHDDPLFKQIFQCDNEGYESRLRAAIREELNAFWQAKQPMIGLFDEDRLLAVACLIAPETGFGPQRFWHWRLKMLLTAGFLGTKQMLEKEQLIQQHMPANHYHMLSFIGVHPDCQHLGLGHILMSAINTLVEEHASSEGVGVFVTLDKYLPFFEDGQYQLIKKLKVGEIEGNIMFLHRTNDYAI